MSKHVVDRMLDEIGRRRRPGVSLALTALEVFDEEERISDIEVDALASTGYAAVKSEGGAWPVVVGASVPWPEECPSSVCQLLDANVSHNGELVISESAPLAEWVWTCGNATGEVAADCRNSFAYRRGQSREVQLKRGNSRYEEIGKKADGGWGTYFRPRRREEYVLEIQLRNGKMLAERHRVRVVASG